ncbi:MAG: hypothetical protein EBS30_00085 [Planctomycetes bacterium]|nr:hypothetical protein [Planctomycetota bacterium]
MNQVVGDAFFKIGKAGCLQLPGFLLFFVCWQKSLIGRQTPCDAECFRKESHIVRVVLRWLAVPMVFDQFPHTGFCKARGFKSLAQTFQCPTQDPARLRI